MNALKPILISFFACWMAACTSQQKEMEKELAGERFGGIIPCADCEGIAYSLNFYANSGYSSVSMYIGESNKKFIEEGLWRTKQDSIIVLNPEAGEARRFVWEGGHLRMLDRSSKAVEGNLSSRYILRNTTESPIWGSLQSEEGSGIDFKAHGNEPFWGLQMDMDGMLIFKEVSGDSINTAIEGVEADSSTGVQRIYARTDSHTLNIFLHPVGCMDSMSGQVYDFRVRINKNGKDYNGCGGFLE